MANAVKYTPSKGKVTIQAVGETHGPRVDVLDTGPGIEPQYRRKVFERFFRLDPGRSTPGFGLLA